MKRYAKQIIRLMILNALLATFYIPTMQAADSTTAKVQNASSANESVSSPANPAVSSTAIPVAAPLGGLKFTGIIIDARGLGLEATFAPAIYDQTGKAVYGTNSIDPKFAVDSGMVDYASTPELVLEAEQGKSRAGNSPMIIKAIALKDNNHSIIINTSDAGKILAANQSAGFLNKCAVVFYK